MSNCPGIRISELTTMTIVGVGDYIVINDNNTYTKKIGLKDFVSSINNSPELNFTTFAKDVILVPPGGDANPLWAKIASSNPVNQDQANNYILVELVRQQEELLALNIRITDIENKDGKYATKEYVDKLVAAEKQERENQDAILMNIKADKYNHYTKAEIDQLLEEIILEGGGIPDAPKDGLQYGRQDESWTEIESLTDAPDDGSLYGRKDGTWTEIGDGVTDLGLDQHTDTTLDITSSTGTDVTIPAATNVLAGLMTAADKVALTNAATGTNLNIANRDADSLEVTSDTGDDALIPAATTTLAGLMTATDKVNLNTAMSGAVAGNNQEVQFNNAGVMGASPDLKFDAISKVLTIDSAQISNGLISVKTTSGNPGAIDLYCEVGNSHRVRLQSPNHASFTGDLNFTLPSAYPTTGQVLTASTSGVMSWTTVPPGYTDADVDTHLRVSTATTGQVLSWTGTDYRWETPFDGDYNSLSNLPTIPPAYGDADVDAHLNKNTANQDQVLSWNGTDYEWQTPATSMNFQGTVDLTDGLTVPAGPDSDGDTYTNTGTGTIDAAWVTASDQSGGTAVSAGDLVIYNTDDSLYHYVPTGGSSPPTDLAVANKTATTLDITSSTGADATVPAVTSTEAGLMTAADKVSLDALAGATDYGDDDVEALFQAYEFDLIPGTNGAYDIGTAEKKVRHLYLSDNSLRFVTDGNVEFPLSVDAPNLFFNSKQVAMVEDIKGGDISTDDNPPATPEDGDLWFNPNTGTLYIYYTDDNSSQWVEIAGPGGGGDGDGASVTVSPNPPVGEQGDLWFNSNDGSLYIFYVDGNSSQWIAIASSGGAGGDGASVSVQPGPPSGAQQGDLWWNTNDGYLYVYYEDGNSNQWVTASPPAEGGSGETPDLQAVTDAGRFTNRTIDIGNVSGDPNIRLNSDGSADFGGGNIGIGSTGFITTETPSGHVNINVTNGAMLVSPDGLSANAVTKIGHDGSAEFAGNIEAAGLTDGTTTKTMTEVLAGGGGDLTLQDVTTNGNTTTNTIKVNDNWFEGYRSGNGASQALSFKYDGGTGLTILADGTHWLGGDVSGFNPNITLNTNGSAEFIGRGRFGDISTGYAGPAVSAYANTSTANSGGIQVKNYGTGANFSGFDAGGTNTAYILADGSASFAKSVSTSGAGWFQVTKDNTNSAFIGASDSELITLHEGASKNIILNANGTASFAGNIKSGNIDTSANDVAGAQILPQGILNVQRPSTDHPEAELAGFWYGDTRTFRFQNAGRLILGGADNGIQFGVTNSGGNITSQTLNDYEEGTWTPTSQTGVTLSSAVAKYIKVGNLVWFSLNAQMTTNGTPGSPHIYGLPFNAKSGGSRGAYPVRNVDNLTDSNNGGAYIETNVIYLQDSTGNGSASTKANITNVSFGITGCYEV